MQRRNPRHLSSSLVCTTQIRLKTNGYSFACYMILFSPVTGPSTHNTHLNRLESSNYKPKQVLMNVLAFALEKLGQFFTAYHEELNAAGAKKRNTYCLTGPAGTNSKFYLNLNTPWLV